MSRKLKVINNDIRNSNLSLVLKLIMDNGPLSRADLAKKTAMMRSTVSSLVDELLTIGYIEEIGLNNSNTVGKKATLLDIRLDKIFAIAVNFTGNDMIVTKIDLKGNCINKTKKMLGESTVDAIIKELHFEIKELLFDIKNKNQFFAGIGVAFPGPVDKGKILYPASFKNLNGLNLYDVLFKEFECPVYVENNADAAALAESWFGKHNMLKTLVYIIIDQGIGSGIVINQELFYGNNHLTNEFGHIKIKTDGPKCFCGNNGCLASLASDRAVLKFTPEDQLKKLSLTEEKEPTAKDILTIIDFLKENSEAFNNYLLEISKYLGIGIANLVDILVPDIILIESSFLSVPYFIDEVIKSTEMHVHPLFKGSINIQPSHLGKNGPLIGAGAFILKDMYLNPLKEFVELD